MGATSSKQRGRQQQQSCQRAEPPRLGLLARTNRKMYALFFSKRNDICLLIAPWARHRQPHSSDDVVCLAVSCLASYLIVKGVTTEGDPIERCWEIGKTCHFVLAWS
jgi:hypothetical protein